MSTSFSFEMPKWYNATYLDYRKNFYKTKYKKHK